MRSVISFLLNSLASVTSIVFSAHSGMTDDQKTSILMPRGESSFGTLDFNKVVLPHLPTTLIPTTGGRSSISLYFNARGYQCQLGNTASALQYSSSRRMCISDRSHPLATIAARTCILPTVVSFVNPASPLSLFFIFIFISINVRGR